MDVLPREVPVVPGMLPHSVRAWVRHVVSCRHHRIPYGLPRGLDHDTLEPAVRALEAIRKKPSPSELYSERYQVQRHAAQSGGTSSFEGLPVPAGPQPDTTQERIRASEGTGDLPPLANDGT